MTEAPPRRMGPLAADHPAVGQPCPACPVALATGDYVTLVMLGPGDNPEQQAKAREGRTYRGVGAVVHWACATGEPAP